MNLTRRAVLVFTSPKTLFEHLRDHPKWIDVLLLFIVLNALLFFPMSPIVEQQGLDKGREQIESRAGMSEEEKAQAIEHSEAFMRGPVYKAFVWGAVFIFTPLFFLLWAVLIWVCFGFMVGGDLSFRQALSGTGHVSLIVILGGLIKLPLILVKKSMFVALSPAILLPEPDPESVMYAALDSFDVFILWALAVLAIGMIPLAKISAGKARSAAIALFIVTFVFRVGGALLGSMFRG